MDDHEDGTVGGPGAAAGGGRIVAGEGGPRGTPLDRRRFLRYSGVTGAVVGADRALGGAVVAAAAPGRWLDLAAPSVLTDADVPWTLTVDVRRPDDLVRLRVRFTNAVVDRSGPVPMVRAIEPGEPVVVVVTFPPQSLAEQALPEVENGLPSPPTPGQLGARLAQPSRLAFDIPPESLAAGVPYTTQGLLDWSRWRLRPARKAAVDPRQALLPADFPLEPTPPSAIETSIEIPWWLQISPGVRTGFLAAATPKVAVHPGVGERTELWHARLATRHGDGSLTEGPSPDRVIRAVWSPDPQLAEFIDQIGQAATETVPFRTSMSQRDRLSLIRLTTDDRQSTFDGLPARTPRGTPVPVDTLTLTALGATLEAGATFQPRTGINLVEWRHQAFVGRDAFVRVVDRGYLAPFAFPCTQVRITERQFLGSANARSAPLVQRVFLIVPKTRIVYGDDGGGAPINGRAIPFRSVEIRATITGNISRAPLLPSPYPVADAYHVVDLDTGRDVQFQVVVTDRDGKRHDLVMPMAFVLATAAESPTISADVRAAWNAIATPTGRRWADLGARRVAYAEPLADRRGATSVTTNRMRWSLTERAQPITSDEGRAGSPQFFPALDVADVRLEEVESLSANAFGATRIRFDPTYLGSGFGEANRAGVWASVQVGSGGAEPPTGASLRFSRPAGQETTPGAGTDRSGGVVTPDLVINGLSRSTGVAAGNLDDLKAGTFDPARFFQGALPTLLGGVALTTVVQSATIPVDGPAPDSVLQIRSRREGETVVAVMRWTPDLRSDPLGVFEPGPASELRVDAEVRTPAPSSGATPSSRTTGELRDVAINVPTKNSMLIRIELDRVRFESRDGRSPDVSVDVRAVRFGGELAWIEAVQKYLSFGGGNGPEISVLPDRVSASIGVALPNLTIGVFALRNIRFSAGLDLPLTGAPARIRFALSSREDPFRMTVLCIGGGGYVAMGFGADGLELLELMIEGGAEVALDLGVASGSVSMTLGIALLLVRQGNEESASLIGHFRMNGSVSAGPVSCSLTLTLQLGYRVRTRNGKSIKTMFGSGTIELDLSVPLVPTPPISISFERSFRADPADPTFADQMTTKDRWREYCDAFAA